MNSATMPSTAISVLLIDDDPDVSKAVSTLFEGAGIKVKAAASPDEAYESLALEPFDVILLDLNFGRGKVGGEEGLACLQRLISDDPASAIIVVTGQSGIRIAVAAMRAGAVDFVMKPWRNVELLERVRSAAGQRRQRIEGSQSDAEDGDVRSSAPRLLGASRTMEQLRGLIHRCGPTLASILIRGASGSGRTLVAEALHHASSRAAKPLVKLDARATADPSDSFAASELARAAEGTLLLRHSDRLDEIRQERLLTRISECAAGTRLISTVTAIEPLLPALRARLGTVEIDIPSLEDRENDALTLARYFAKQAAHTHERSFHGFTDEAEAAILAVRWPDSVRGLRQAVERAIILSDGPALTKEDLGLSTEQPQRAARPASPSLNLERSERELVSAALKVHGFNVSKAAAELGLSRAALYRRITKYGL